MNTQNYSNMPFPIETVSQVQIHKT